MLKLNGGKGFFFPRRQRFNEDVASEIESQRKDLQSQKGQPADLTPGALAGNADKASKVGSQNSKVTKDKNLTASELSRYFNNKSNV